MQRIAPLDDAQVVSWEERLEAQMVASLQAVMDQIADRIAKIQVASAWLDAARIEVDIPLRALIAAVTTGPTGDDLPPPMSAELAIPDPPITPEAIVETPALPPGQPYISADDLASITPLWQQQVAEQILPLVAQVFIDSAGNIRSQLLESVAPNVTVTMPRLGSIAAEQYLATARNSFDEVGDHLWATARAQMSQGFDAGESIPQIADRLRQSAGLTARQGVLVARTSVIEASNSGSLQMAQVSGLQMQKEWIATIGDGRTRPSHLAADGQRVDLNEPFLLITGNSGMFPADPSFPPADRYRCRCTIGYVMPDKPKEVEPRLSPRLDQLPGTSGLPAIEGLPKLEPGEEGPLTQFFPKVAGPDFDIPARGPTAPPGYVRPSLKAAKTPRELRRAWQDEVEAITGHPFHVDAMPRGISMVTAREYAEGTLQMFDRFPGAKMDRIHWFDDAQSSAYAQVRRGGHAIEFNMKYASETGRPKFLDARRRDAAGWDVGDTSWGVRNDTTGQGVVYHEFMHILDLENTRERIHGSLVPLLIREADREGVTDVVSLIERRVSSYAASSKGNMQELIAEAGCDVMVNGAQASELSRGIFDLLQAEYRARGFALRTAPVDELAAEAERLGEVFPKAAAPRALSSQTVAQLRGMAKERGIIVPAGTRKADLVKMLEETPPTPAAVAPIAIVEAPPLSRAPLAYQERQAQLREAAAIRLAEARPDLATVKSQARAAARAQAATVATQRGNAALIARIDELVQAKASKAVIRQELDPALRQAEQLYAGADAATADALRAAIDSGEPAKIRAALTRQSKANGLTPIGKAGAKAKFDPATMEGVGGTAIPDGADVIVVRRGAKIVGLETPEKATVRRDVVKPRPVGSSKEAIRVNGDVERRARTGVVEGSEVDPGQGVSAITRRVQFEDGSYGWRKVAHGEESLDDEYLDNLVLQAAGAPAPGVYRASANTLFMEDVEGAIGRDLTQAQQEAVLESADGRLIGLGDAIMGNGDRHVFSANYIRTPDGRIVPIDNAPNLVLRNGNDTFEFQEPRDFQGRPLPVQGQEGNDFLERWVDRGPEGYGVRPRVGSELQDDNLRDWNGALVDVWRPDNDLTAAEHKAIRGRLEALRPEFERLDRGERLDYIEGRLDAIFDVSAARLPASTAKTVAKGDFTGLTRVGEQLGGNPGGIFEAGDGSRWYIKAARDPEQLRSEALALDLYRASGLDVPDVVLGEGLGELGQGTQIASRIVEGAEADLRQRLADEAYRAQVQEGFAVDAWLGNRDVLGTSLDNILTTAAGTPIRIEAGGALRFRALGEAKDFGPDVSELDTMRAAGRSAAKVFGDMTPKQIIASAERVRKVTPAKIKALVKKHKLDPELADTLIARRADILKRAEALAGPKPMTVREYQAAIKAAAKREQAMGQTGVVLRRAAEGDLQPSAFGLAEDLGGAIERALIKYQENDFQPINDALRLGASGDDSTYAQTVAKFGRPRVVDMDRAFDQSRLAEDVEMWRGPGSGRGIFGDPATWGDDLTGFEWSDPAYSSASADRKIADRFTKDGGVRLRILAPKGSKAIQLSDWPGIRPGTGEDEAEVLLARGARYRVVKDRGWTEITHPTTHQKIRIRDLDVEVVVPDVTPPLPWETK